MSLKIGEYYETHAAVLYLTILEEKHCGDVAYADFGYDFLILVDV